MTPNGFLKVCIANQEYDAKLDTGADLNLISEKVFNNLPVQYRNRLDRSKAGNAKVANQVTVTTLGTLQLPILVDRQLFKIEFTVFPDALFPVFLGKPFHKKTAAMVNHLTDTIKLTNSTPIYSEASFEIEPYREVMCHGKLHEIVPEGSIGLCAYTPAINEKGVLVANAMVMTRDNSVPMRIYNATEQQIKINRGERIGTFTMSEDDDLCIPFPLDESEKSQSVRDDTMKYVGSVTNSDKQYDPQFDFSGSKLNREQLGKLKRLLRKYHMCFVDPNNKQIGLTNVLTAKIETIPGAIPVKRYPYRMAPVHKEALNKIVQEQIDIGILEPTNDGAWASPALLVAKPGNNGYRLVCDFRELNKVTIPVVLRIPRIDDVLDSVGEAKPKYFSVLDLTHGFHQIPLDEESKDKCSFLVDNQKLRLTRMGQGLRNSSAIFQNMMDTVLKGIQHKYICSYIDDLILFSSTFEKHLEHIEEVLIRIKNANLKLSPKKCKFAVPRVKFLGHILSEEGVEPNDEKLEAIKSYPTPKTMKEVRGFLGVTGYYRRFVEKYADIAKPLYNLTKKNVPFVWSSECENAFQTLKNALIGGKILAFPDFSKKFVLATDASNIGVGACLSQEHDGVLKPVGYAGRGFTAAELNYHTTDKELLAVVFGVQQFKIYLIGAHFELHTDHAALRQILTTKNLEGRQARWVTFLQGFNFTPIYIKGKENIVPDALSRRHYDVTHTDADEVIENYPDISAINQINQQPIMIGPQPPKVTTNKQKHVSFAPGVTQDCIPILKSEFNECLARSDDNHDQAKSVKCHAGTDPDANKSAKSVTASVNKLPPPIFKEDVDKLSAYEPRSVRDNPSVNAISRAKINARRDKLQPDLQHNANSALNELDLSVGKIKAAQNKDPQTKTIINFLKYGRLPRNDKEARSILLRQEDYIVIDDILYHIHVPLAQKSTKAIAQLVVPQDLKKHVLYTHHDVALAGHTGIQRMISVMKQRYFWIGMVRDINEYVTTCKSCNQSKASNRNLIMPLTIRHPSPAPYHSMFIDCLGPLVKTARNHKYLVVVTDQYSRYVIAWPSPDITAKTIAAQFYQKVICVYGAPKRLLSDNGSSFIGQVFKELCTQFNIQQCFSTSYHPQAQGSVERANRSIINLMRNFVNSKQTDWDLYVAPLAFALNSSDNSPLGYSAYMMVFGRAPSLPSDQDLLDPLNNNHTAQDHFIDILQTQLECHDYAMKHLKHEQDKMKKRYDSTANEAPLLPGDIVFVYQPRLRVRNTKKKLQKSFHGPFIIVDFKTLKAVILKRVSDGKVLEKSVSVDRLKRGSIRANTNNWDPLPVYLDQDDDDLNEDDIPDDSFTITDDNHNDNDVGSNDTDNTNDQNTQTIVIGPTKKRGRPRKLNLSDHVEGSEPKARASMRANKGQITRNKDFVY